MFKFTYLCIYTAIFTLLAPISAIAETFDYRFDVRLGLAKIGEMQVAANNDGSSYSVAASLYTTGLVGAVYDVRYKQSAMGRIGVGGALVPVRHTSTNDEQGKISKLEIGYSGDRVASVVFDPAKTVPAGVTRYRNTVDPMSLMYFLLRPTSVAKVCTGAVTLFDGANRSSVKFTEVLKFDDGQVECSVSYSTDGKNGGIAVSALVFVPDGDGMMRIRSFDAHTSIGTLKIKAR